MAKTSKTKALIALKKLDKNIAIHTSGGFITGKLDSISKEKNPDLYLFRSVLDNLKDKDAEPSSVLLQDVTITNAAGINKLPFMMIFIEDILGISLADFETEDN